jgi:hypothetical protein
MFFNPNMEGTTSFTDVALSAGAFYFVNSFAFVRVKFVFNISHILFDGFMWFEEGLDLFFTKDFCNLIGYSLDVRQVGILLGFWFSRELGILLVFSRALFIAFLMSLCL